MKTGHSKLLNQKYIVNSDYDLTFEDNTVYTRKEMKFLSGQSPDMLVGVHKIKKLFDGEVVE